MTLELNFHKLHQKTPFFIWIQYNPDYYQLTLQTIFVLAVDTIISYKLAKLFVIHVFFKDSILSHITSDYRSEFISNFFQSLETTLNMQLHFISGYHPKRDRQTENTNKILEQYLYIYYNY